MTNMGTAASTTESSMAGPAPNYDMQRILSARTPKEAVKMSGLVSLVLMVPRYMLITGLTVLALVFFRDDVRDARVMPFEVKVRRGDDAVQVLQGGSRRTRERRRARESSRLLRRSALTEFRSDAARHLGRIRGDGWSLLGCQLERVRLCLEQARGDDTRGRTQPGATGDGGTVLR